MKVGDLVTISSVFVNELNKVSTHAGSHVTNWATLLGVGTIVSIELVGGITTDTVPSNQESMVVVLWSGNGSLSWETPRMLVVQSKN